jgi:hypothetical protein
MISYSYVNNTNRLSSLLRASGGTKDAAALIDLVYRIGPEHLFTFDSQLPWYTTNNSRSPIKKMSKMSHTNNNNNNDD